MLKAYILFKKCFYFIHFILFHFEQFILSASGDEKLKHLTKLAGQPAKLS